MARGRQNLSHAPPHACGASNAPGVAACDNYLCRAGQTYQDYYWTLAFFAVLRWLTQKALQDRQGIGQLYRLLTDGLHEGARVFVAMVTHHIGQRTQAFLG